ncbi:hypothetical protein F3Y22_tig00006230pilonHSYRG00016 [Hibiscus syriacus]|uniref:Pollen Ole e 1 allergen and extensin family protein n=1 Tax=Hibiscus syriacus TaxID=106335 RepID=A0A6A3CC55_HIBSY|nr:hypothetical protein F3Y22_tig00006230pilonHSYRG00016 [Hibiscus syriacus]
MATTYLALLISSLLLLPLALTAYETVPQEKKTEVVVEGMVYCQSCDTYGSWSLSKAEPIASAKVRVVCRNQRGRVSFYTAFETDAKGYFFAELEGCNMMSNVNYGLYGSPLRYESKRLYRKDYDVVIYAAGPLAFRPAHFPAPTHY